MGKQKSQANLQGYGVSGFLFIVPSFALLMVLFFGPETSDESRGAALSAFICATFFYLGVALCRDAWRKHRKLIEIFKKKESS